MKLIQLWWKFLHAVLPWWVLRRVCEMCEPFHHDPRDREWWDDFFQNAMDDDESAGIYLADTDLSTIEIRDNRFESTPTPGAE